ncbi:MAG: FAD-dependent oxidoreductase [Deltaproteobacteria bacterium]|nr:FAD-dependent oxidoreductase [Deltaproteobacteria bacterium]
MTRLENLFSPGYIGKMKLDNRLVMAPMGTFSNDHKEGYVLDKTVDFYEERAKGGVGLIVCQSSMILSESCAPGRLSIWNDKFIPGLSKIADAIHRHGGKGAMQILHHGKLLTSHRKKMEHPENIIPLAPSAIPWGGKNKEVPIEATEKDILRLVQGFAEAALRVRKAGFDAVEVNGAHGYCIGQFLSPRTNKRRDEYGGTPAKRARFACEIISAIKNRVGSSFPVIFRMSGSEFIRGGISLEDSLIQAPLIAEAGADALEVSGGVVEMAHITNPCYLHPDAPFSDLAASIKRVVSVPIMVVGKIGDPELAERLIEEQKADFVMMGRPLLADPYLPNKAKAGDLNKIRRCIYCNNCWDTMWRESFWSRGLSCTVNPGLLREKEFSLKKTTFPRKILVVGGGLAGIEAARTLARRGHQTILCEKDTKLGGQWNAASLMKGKALYARFAQQLSSDLVESGAEVMLGCEADVELVRQISPDVVIVAAGATPRTLAVKGAELPHVVQALDVLCERVETGERIVVVGGRALGMETALMLAEKGKRVSIVTERALGQNHRFMERYTLLTLRDQLIEQGVYIYPHSPLEEIYSDGVYVLHGADLLFIRADTVVLAVGVTPQKTLYGDIKATLPSLEIYTIGDSLEARDAMEAIREGAEIGRSI